MTNQDKIRELFYSPHEENRNAAYKLAKDTNCYEEMIHEFYDLLGEIPNFEYVKEGYEDMLEDEGKTAPEGIELKKAYIEFFVCFFFIGEINLSNRNRFPAEEDKLKKFPKVLFNLKHIKSIDISWNAIQSIPEELTQLSMLEELDLACNNLRNGLPDSFGALSQLKKLDLYANKGIFYKRKFINEHPTLDKHTNELSPCIRQLKNLEHLNLCDIVISELPEWIDELTNLQSLLLFSGLGSHPRIKIPDSFTNLSNLKTFQASSFTVQVPEDIDKMQALEYLVLEPALNVPTAIKKLKNLKYLDLSGIPYEYKIDYDGCHNIWNLYKKGFPEGVSRLKLYGWEFLKEMTWLEEFVFKHIEPMAFTELEKTELATALPNCKFTFEY